ncbi:MAG TPA: hypothetical protein DDW52_13615 [Planctomycetaceae bacterium]|nr:hypothetical protein [Planctomycetaceae bacterium]
MNSTLATGLLPAEFALALRIHREEVIAPELLHWLRNPNRGPRYAGTKSEVSAAVEELLGPITKNSDKWESGELRDASVWFGFAIEQVFGYVPDQPEAVAIFRRLVLSSLLPLYRALATGELSLSFTASRVRLSETLTIAAAANVLGAPFIELLLDGDRKRLCPDETVLEHLDLDVSGLAAVAEELAKSAAHETEADSSWLTNESIDAYIPDRPEWASPTLLWKLAGEVTNQRAVTLLPRSWADVALPWQKVTAHWRKLESIFDRVRDDQSSRAKGPSSPLDNSVAGRPADATAAQSNAPDSESIAADTVAQERGVESIEACLDTASANVDELSSTYSDRGASNVTPNEPTHSAEPVDRGRIGDHDADAHSNTSQDSEDEGLPAGSVSAAEIHGHNDPIFVGAVNRLIGICRKQGRDVALATVSVKPDSDPPGPVFSLGDDGLPRWQGRLIEAISTSPEIDEVACYVSNKSELLITLLDADRNEAAQAVRECVQESLSPTARYNSLATIDVPAKFFIAVAACNRPGPQVTAQDLIAPCRDIFDAIVQRGNTAVKSKEVY